MPPHASLSDPSRLVELRSLAILDTPPEPDYDDLAALAAAVCRSSVAAVNFVDHERHFTKAVTGMPEARGASMPNHLSFCATTVATPGGSLVVPDTRAVDGWRDHPLVTGGPEIGFYAGVSIVSRGETVGVVCTFGKDPREVTRQEHEGLVTLARQATALLTLRRRNLELRDLAVTDPLTGLANRTLLYDRLQLALSDRARNGGEVAVLFCDVDNFKRVNDRYGHEAGDRLLCDIADHLRSVARDTDTVARIAGDEFVLVCPQLRAGDDIEAIARRVAGASGRRQPMPDGGAPPGLSVGAVLAVDGEDAAGLLRRADARMYLAKAGRRSALSHARQVTRSGRSLGGPVPGAVT